LNHFKTHNNALGFPVESPAIDVNGTNSVLLS